MLAIIHKSRLYHQYSTSTYQIHRTTNQVVLHTRTILGTTTTDLNDTVLLDIMSYKYLILAIYPAIVHR